MLDLWCPPVSILITLVTVRLFLGKFGECFVQLPFLKRDAIAAQYKEIWSVLNIAKVIRGFIEEFQPQRTGLGIELEHVGVVLVLKSCRELQMAAFCGDPAPHFPAGKNRVHIAAV